jgi:hypothetical protein
MSRVAICYSGQPRDVENTFENHRVSLILPLIAAGYEVDIFAHIWFDTSKLSEPYWVDYPERGYWSEQTKLFIEKNISPNTLVFSEPISFDACSYTPDQRFPHPIQNTLSMFYGIEQVFTLKREYQVNNDVKYDWSIRIRPDLFFRSKFDAELLLQLNNSAINVLFDKNKHMNYAIGDHFAIGPDILMNKYAEVFSNFEKIIANKIPVNPECLLGGWLMMEEVGVEFQNWNHCLYRDRTPAGLKDKFIAFIKGRVR